MCSVLQINKDEFFTNSRRWNSVSFLSELKKLKAHSKDQYSWLPDFWSFTSFLHLSFRLRCDGVVRRVNSNYNSSLLLADWTGLNCWQACLETSLMTSPNQNRTMNQFIRFTKEESPNIRNQASSHVTQSCGFKRLSELNWTLPDSFFKVTRRQTNYRSSLFNMNLFVLLPAVLWSQQRKTRHRSHHSVVQIWHTYI